MKMKNLNSKILSEPECEASYISTSINDKQITVICSSDFRSAFLYKNNKHVKKFNGNIFNVGLNLKQK